MGIRGKKGGTNVPLLLPLYIHTHDAPHTHPPQWSSPFSVASGGGRSSCWAAMAARGGREIRGGGASSTHSIAAREGV